MDSLRLVVTVPTYQRPQVLAENLAAVCAQAGALGPVGGVPVVVRVVVVDNDPGCSARATVAGVGVAASVDVAYVSEQAPGIVAVRNTCLDLAADDDLLVFIDDDEVPHDNWLQALIDAWHAYEADAVWGRVVSVFDAPLDPWIEEGAFFVRKARRTGDQVERAATGNLLLDMRTVRRLGLRFDAWMGLGGGEDSLFSATLSAAGGKIVWCDEAAADDLVPVSRATRRWVLERAMSHGNSHVRLQRRLVGRTPARYVVAGRALSGGAARVGYGGARYAAGVVARSRRLEARGAQGLFRGVGFIAGGLGLKYEEYSRSARTLTRFSCDPVPRSTPAKREPS